MPFNCDPINASRMSLPALSSLREELASSIRRLESSAREVDCDAMDVDSDDLLFTPIALLSRIDQATFSPLHLSSDPGPSVPPPDPTTPTTKPLDLRTELFSSVEAACNDLHGALRRNRRILSGAEAGPSSGTAARSDALSDPAFLRTIVDYSRKISFGAHPGWFVPGQFFGDRRSWAPFAGEQKAAVSFPLPSFFSLWCKRT